MAADYIGRFKVTFRDSKGRESAMELVDRRSEVEEQARFFALSRGRVVKVEAVK